MRTVQIALVMCFAAALPASAQNNSTGSAQAQVSGVQQEVLKLEELGRQRSLKGETNWDDLIADGAYLIGPDGSVVTYAKGQKMPSYPITSFKLSDLIARQFGDAVIVTGLAEIELLSPEKKPVTFKMRYTNVWAKDSATWKIVVSERTGVKDSVKY